MRRSTVVLSLTILLLGTIAWSGPWRTVLAAPHSGASTSKLHCKYGTKTVTKKVHGKKKKVKVCKAKPKPAPTAVPTDTPVPPTATATPQATSTSTPTLASAIELQPVSQTAQQVPAPFTLGQPVSYPAGTNPIDLAVGDFNKDGHQDIAVINAGSNTLSIFMNDGTGKFLPKVDYPTGSNPVAIGAGDLIGDGYPDIAVLNAGSNSLSIFINKGNGTFTAPQHSAFLRRQATGNANQCNASTAGLAPITRSQASTQLPGEYSLSCFGETAPDTTPGESAVFNLQPRTGSTPPAITVATLKSISRVQLVPAASGPGANEKVTVLSQAVPFTVTGLAVDRSAPPGFSDYVYYTGPDAKRPGFNGAYVGAGADGAYTMEESYHISGLTLPANPAAVQFYTNPEYVNTVVAAQKGTEWEAVKFTWTPNTPGSIPTVTQSPLPFQPTSLFAGSLNNVAVVYAVNLQGSGVGTTYLPNGALSQWDSSMPPAQITFGVIGTGIASVGPNGWTLQSIQEPSVGTGTYQYVGNNDVAFTFNLAGAAVGKTVKIALKGGGLFRARSSQHNDGSSWRTRLLSGPFSAGLPQGWSVSATSDGVAISGPTAFPQMWSFRLGNFNPPTGTITATLFDQSNAVLGTIPVTSG